MNSMGDITACIAGMILAHMLPVRVSVVFVVLLEVILAVWIRDNLALNILMLIHPIQVVRAWQTGG